MQVSFLSNHARDAGKSFDAWADHFEDNRISRWFQHYQLRALSELNLCKGQRLLDIGCGTGWAVREAARRCKNGTFCGIDISENMIEQAKERSKNVSQYISFQVANAESIPFPDQTFDAVVCTCSFHHYENPIQVLSEIHRVVKCGGTFALLDPARDVSVAIWVQDRFRRFFERSHVRYYTTEEIKTLLQETNWNLSQELVTFKRILDHGKLFTGLMLTKCTKRS